MVLLASAVGRVLASGIDFDVLHAFDVADPNTGKSASGSQPDTRPVVAHDGGIYGMTYLGGENGTGVIYRFRRGRYTVLHDFGMLDAKGSNSDGAYPGVALTADGHHTLYGMASSGGANGQGTVFSITKSGKFTVLYTFGATDSHGANDDGAAPLRTIIIGKDGNLYGTTRLGGHNGLGVAWVMTVSGALSVIHHYTASEGHAASLTQGRDGYLYGCGVWPSAAASGPRTLYRMSPSGGYFEVLHTFKPMVSGANTDGADCYEPLTEVGNGIFMGAAADGGTNGNGVVFRYSSATNGLEVVHAFAATNAAGRNSDGAFPYARLTPGRDGWLYSTASFGGHHASGVVYRLNQRGTFEVLHTFSAIDAVTGSNRDGNDPDYGVVRDGDDAWVGMADYGGLGSAAGAIGNGTLYRFRLGD
jgi:uncharacterized repeat protein (TIGR03803 family)